MLCLESTHPTRPHTRFKIIVFKDHRSHSYFFGAREQPVLKRLYQNRHSCDCPMRHHPSPCVFLLSPPRMSCPGVMSESSVRFGRCERVCDDRAAQPAVAMTTPSVLVHSLLVPIFFNPSRSAFGAIYWTPRVLSLFCVCVTCHEPPAARPLRKTRCLPFGQQASGNRFRPVVRTPQNNASSIPSHHFP